MLEALEAFGPAALFRSSIALYPLVNAVHILAIGALVTSAALMDLRVLGLGRRVVMTDAIALLRPVAIAALVVAALTGATLFTVQPVDYFENPAFRIKMLLLALAILNALVFTFGRRHRDAGSGLTRIMALFSILLWISVALAGRFIGFVS